MVIVYDMSTRKVVSSLHANAAFADGYEMLKTMYPNDYEKYSTCVVETNGRLPHNCHVEIVDDVVYRVHDGKKDFFKADPEELRRQAEDKRRHERVELMRSMPYKVGDALFKVLDECIPSSKKVKSSIISDIRSNKYFKRDIIPVGWWGSFLDAGGYANMNREIVQRLPNYGIIPHLDMYPTPAQVDRGTENTLRAYSDLKPKSDRHPFVYAFTPMPHKRYRGKRIFYTMMETCTLHPDFTNYCNEFSDEVWVPSVANKTLFESNGVNNHIRVMPLGIDGGLYFPDCPRSIDLKNCVGIYGRPPSKGIASYRFLSVIQWNFRKGYDALIKSFCKAFDSSDDVCLVIGTQYSADTILNDLREFLPRTVNLPQVLLYNQVVPINEMPSLYDCCDCYVHLSRGEGFSLTQIEAAARGLPVISCCHSGMTEYMREDNSYPVYCDEREKCHPKLSAISYFYQGQYLWKVGPRQVDMAADLMRHVIDNPDESRGKASVLKEEVRNRYTWEDATRRVAEALRS